MNIHKNAKLTALGRADLVRRVLEGEKPKAVALALGLDLKTVNKWVARFVAEGPSGLEDRSSRPHETPSATPTEKTDRIIALRRQRLTGQQIAREVGVSPATVSRVLQKAGLSRIKDLEPAPPVIRYERANPGDLLHIDIKTLGRFDKAGHRVTGKRTVDSKTRGAGWESVHLAIDDHSRVAFAQVLADESGASAVAFLEAAVAYYRALGVTITRVMTDNGGCYISRAFAKACERLKLKHLRTKPYTPKTNGKAERFVQTSLREWAYARPYESSAQREAALQPFLHRYNWHRPHSALNRQPPMSRIPAMNNLLELNS